MAPLMQEKRIQGELSYPILLAERVRAAVVDAISFKAECGEVGRQVDRLLQTLRAVVRFITSAQSLYERPILRVVSEVLKNLERASTLVRKCKRRSVLRRIVTIVTAAEFRKLSNLLDASVGDMRWLLSIFDSENGGASGGIVLTLPPIASNDPILAWVWSCIATLHTAQLSDCIEASIELVSLAKDNDRNKKIIIEEGGVPPLLKLLKETKSSDAQFAASTLLYNIANDQERVRVIVTELGVPIIVNVLSDSIMKVQIQVARLVARMAEHDELARDDFARENVIRPLVTLLSLENYSSYTHLQNRKDGENEKPEVKINLKIACAKALWMLARESVENSRKITETKGLLCLAKLVEMEEGELQLNCLMTIMEITATAECNADLRHTTFKTNLRAAKAVVDQLLRVIKDSDTPTLLIPAIKSIGSLARTFPARETRVIGPLVAQLSHRNQEVATEAAIALQKFASPENFLCIEHSKAIIEFNGVLPLMRLLRGIDRRKSHGLVLLCYLALHGAGTSEASEQARVLTVLEGADRSVVAQHPELKKLLSKALYHLSLYQTGVHPHRQVYAP